MMIFGLLFMLAIIALPVFIVIALVVLLRKGNQGK